MVRQRTGSTGAQDPRRPTEQDRAVGPRLKALRIVALDPDAQPPELTVEADLAGPRYVENRDTLDLVSGTRDREVSFTERWTLVLGDGPSPWRIARLSAAPRA